MSTANIWLGICIILDPDGASSSQLCTSGLVELGHLLHLLRRSPLSTRIQQSQKDRPKNPEQLKEQASPQPDRGAGRISKGAMLFHDGNQRCSSREQKQRRLPAK